MHPSLVAQQRVVFVGGLHRSGTSPLTRILGLHPAISVFANTGVPEDEGQHLQDVYLPALAHGGPGQFGFDEAAHLTEASELVTAANKHRLVASWSMHWDLSKRLLVEKSPPNLIRGRFLQALFPEASFLMIVRHPVVVSLATAKWAAVTFENLLAHWVHCHKLLLQDAEHLRNLLVVRYEDLTQSTAQSGDDLDRFLQVTVKGLFTPGLFRPGINERYAEALTADQWATIARSEEMCAVTAAFFGYELGRPAVVQDWRWRQQPEL